MVPRQVFNRRDFLRTAAAGALATQFPDLVPAADEKKAQKGDEKANSMSDFMIIQMPSEVTRQMEVNKKAQKPLMALLSDGTKRAELSLAQLVERSATLSTYPMRRGDELIYGDIFALKLNEYDEAQRLADKVDVEAVKMPGLHLMASIYDRFPGYLSTLNNQQVNQLALGVVSYVAKEQTDLSERPLVTRGSNMLSLLYESSAFTPRLIQGIGKTYGLNMVGIHGGSEVKEGADTKGDYLRDVGRLAADRTRLGLIWNFTHSNDTHIVLRKYPENASVREILEKDAISGGELAKALVEGQVEGIGKVRKSGGKPIEEINLSHLTFFLEGCLQADFAQYHMNSEVFKCSDEHGLPVTGLPLIATASQHGMIGNDFSRLRDDGIMHKSKFQLAFNRLSIALGDPVLVSHLLGIDRDIGRSFEAIHKIGLAPTRQDMVVYSPNVINIDELAGGLVRDLKLPPLPEKRRPLNPGQQRSMEISMDNVLRDYFS